MREWLRRIGAVLDHQSRWDELRTIGNSRLVKLTIIVPLIGYMILFNDQLVKYLELSSPYFRDVFLSGETGSGTTWSLAYRLYCFYFGFTALAIGALVYEFRCPKLVQTYGSAAEFYRVEGPTTGNQQLETMAIPRLTAEFEDKCAPFGIHAKDLWLFFNESRSSFKSNDDRIKLTLIFDSMQERIAELAKGADSEKAAVMKDYFAPLKSVRPISRWTTLALYYVGFTVLAVPTFHSFISVIATVTDKLAA
jgi:hypothetical protein